MTNETGKEVSRRSMLASTATGVTALAASALSLPAEASRSGNDLGIYSHGMVWNPTNPGVAGEVKLAFELWLDLETGKGLGMAQDPLHPDWEHYFAITSFDTEKEKDQIEYHLKGIVTRAAAATNVGLPVRIIAYVEPNGEFTSVGIALGDLGFGGAGILSSTRLTLDPVALSRSVTKTVTR